MFIKSKVLPFTDREDSLDESYMDFQKRSQPIDDLEVDDDHVFDQNAPVMDDDDDDGFCGGFVGNDGGSDNEGDLVVLDEKRDQLRADGKMFKGNFFFQTILVITKRSNLQFWFKAL